MLKIQYLITGMLKHKWFILFFNIYFTENIDTFKDAQTKDLEELKKWIQGEFVLILVLFAYQLYVKRHSKYELCSGSSFKLK